MGIKKTLGGNRLGGGKKMTQELHGYGKSSFDISKVWKTTMAPGTIVPFGINILQTGSSISIDLKTAVLTMPTIGPLFGSYKLQIDAFAIPMRLYNKQMHNNPSGTGRDVSKIIFPQLRIIGRKFNPKLPQPNAQQIAQDSLLAYTGTRGLGRGEIGTAANTIERYRNAMPILAYYDIVKNFYCNQQEEKGYVISADLLKAQPQIQRIYKNSQDITNTIGDVSFNIGDLLRIEGEGLEADNLTIYIKSAGYYNILGFGTQTSNPMDKNRVSIKITTFITTVDNTDASGARRIQIQDTENSFIDKIALKEFQLSEIDDMRERIFEQDKGSALIIESDEYPWKAITGTVLAGRQTDSLSKFSQAGLALATYASDRFNNWINTEWIDGENGITALTTMDVSDGLNMDALNFNKSKYNLMNRIAFAGGTLQNWREAVYGVSGVGLAEIPMYIGGLSSEIQFSQVVSTAETTDQQGNTNPLGTLGGRGYDTKDRGGTIRFRADEEMIIMLTAVIRPRIEYSQGNKWWADIETLDDLHKPEFDGIGYQDLVTEELAAFDTIVDDEGNITKKAIGKQTSYIEYQTDTNENFGNFSIENNQNFMVLDRDYDHDESTGELVDPTTYIDPTKYNKIFAKTDIKAENFWVVVSMDTSVKRIMSAKQIPVV